MEFLILKDQSLFFCISSQSSGSIPPSYFEFSPAVAYLLSYLSSKTLIFDSLLPKDP
jgi:hypothetical protein